MNHHHLYLLLIFLWSSILSVCWWFFWSDLFIYVACFNLIIITLVFFNYYSSVRPKASIYTIFLLSVTWVSLLSFFLWSIFDVDLFHIMPNALLLTWLLVIWVSHFTLSWWVSVLNYLNINSKQFFIWLFFLILLTNTSKIYWMFSWVSWSPDTDDRWTMNIAWIIDKMPTSDTSVSENEDIRLFSMYFGNDEAVTYLDFIPLLWERYDGKIVSQNLDFSYISKESTLYPSFSYAVSKWMIWTWFDPDTRLKCWNLFVLLWLAQWRDLSYSNETVLDVFREEADRRWFTQYGCDFVWTLVVWSMLP